MINFSRPRFVTCIRSLAASILGIALLTSSTVANAIVIDWATIGDAGNAADLNGVGGVGYEYRISKHEVTNAQYVEFLNAVATSDPYALYNSNMGSDTVGGITRSGSPGSYTYSVKTTAAGQGPGGTDYAYANKPVVYVSWYDTIRFANWLTSGATESGTYTITGGGPNAGSVTVPDHSTFAAGSETFFLPSEDEWYKAAYYGSSVSTFYGWPTGFPGTDPNNNLPSADTGESANFLDSGYTTGDSSYPLTDVGAYGLSASDYGTFDQGGNVWEWNEKEIVSPFGNIRGLRGGSWSSGKSSLEAFSPIDADAATETNDYGFRVAGSAESAVPEPSTYALAAIGLLGLLAYRRFR